MRWASLAQARTVGIDAGVSISDHQGGDAVRNCYIGVIPDGTATSGHFAYGIEIESSRNDVIDGNVISGNDSAG